MDMRIQKTRRAIKRSFLSLLASRDLEQITVKALCQSAEISKGTFYLHYRDLYDLSDQLQREAIRDVLSRIPDSTQILSDLPGFLKKVHTAMEAEEAATKTLFSGSQELLFPVLLEQELKERIFALHPECREDVRINVTLSYHIFGGFYSYQENQPRFGDGPVLQMLRENHIQYG